MNPTDIRATAIANEVYPMLAECASNSGVTVSDLIRELAAKQQLIDIRAAVSNRQDFAIQASGGQDHARAHQGADYAWMDGEGTALGQDGVDGAMSNDHRDNIVMDAAQSTGTRQ